MSLMLLSDVFVHKLELFLLLPSSGSPLFQEYFLEITCRWNSIAKDIQVEIMSFISHCIEITLFNII